MFESILDRFLMSGFSSFVFKSPIRNIIRKRILRVSDDTWTRLDAENAAAIDEWNLSGIRLGCDKPSEIFRFKKTNQFIEKHIGKVGTLIEVGSVVSALG